MSEATFTEPVEPDDRIPDDQLTDDELAARRARNASQATRRIESTAVRKEREAREAAEAKLAVYERREALAKARDELGAEGPLGAFLKAYDGEPTADAIRKAISEDPDFRDLITIPPDPRDVARDEQVKTAQNMAGGEAPHLGQITPTDAAGWDAAAKTAFMQSHPDLWNDLLAGKPVPQPVT